MLFSFLLGVTGRMLTITLYIYIYAYFLLEEEWPLPSLANSSFAYVNVAAPIIVIISG